MSESYIDAAAQAAAGILTSKRKDYASMGEFSNFEAASEFADVSVEQAIMVLIGVKLARWENLKLSLEPNHESLEDTMLDLQNYINILRAWRTKRQEEIDF